MGVTADVYNWITNDIHDNTASHIISVDSHKAIHNQQNVNTACNSKVYGRHKNSIGRYDRSAGNCSRDSSKMNESKESCDKGSNGESSNNGM